MEIEPLYSESALPTARTRPPAWNASERAQWDWIPPGALRRVFRAIAALEREAEMMRRAFESKSFGSRPTDETLQISQVRP